MTKNRNSSCDDKCDDKLKVRIRQSDDGCKKKLEIKNNSFKVKVRVKD
ncbi:hypothetical protein [Dehalobacterium formicoaceticum]|uniref:Uncharacterized protein n=1 Tax=Dehalobacterium formicoaceticum TaxID=51515 RepID=A0ABT1Y6Z1_9FIRM|nr:hypothetical protein [Dehalobacterium formicoaceticum]MCR6546633.1 hypothetical protein [Dehalobacterium formicoaceticum]